VAGKVPSQASNPVGANGNPIPRGAGQASAASHTRTPAAGGFPPAGVASASGAGNAAARRHPLSARAARTKYSGH